MARAFCPEVTLAAPSNYDPAAAGNCFDTDPATGALLPTLFWRNSCVSFSLQKGASSQISLSVATRVAQQAFATWADISCGSGPPGITPVLFPAVACSDVPSQGHNNAIVFRDTDWPYEGVNALGKTTLTVDKTTGEIFGATIEINSTRIIVAAPPAPDGAYDLTSILTHEAGHFLGLAHTTDTSAVMYAYYQRGSTALTFDDIAGICSIYPPDGTRLTSRGNVDPTSCDPTPPYGFLSTCAPDGGAPDAGGEGGAAPDPCSPAACDVAAGPSVSALPAALCIGAVVLAAGVRRASRRAKPAGPRSGATPLFLLLVMALGASTLVTQHAQASVSIAVRFDELLERSTAVAVVTPTEQVSIWEEGRIATYTRVRVERRVAGSVGADAWIRTLGGSVGNIAQVVEGEAAFPPGKSSLVFLRLRVDPVSKSPTGALVVVESAQGQFPISPTPGSRLTLAIDVGALVNPGQRSPGGGPRLAREVLEGRSLDDVAREVASAWPHGPPGRGQDPSAQPRPFQDCSSTRAR